MTNKNLRSGVSFREALTTDIPELAEIRAKNWGSEEYWNHRISGYLEGTLNPQQALKPRIIYIAQVNNLIIGLIAGHLTQRLGCDGELEWIDIRKEFQRKGIASELIRLLAKWFVSQKACKICIDPGSEEAKEFYRKNGAQMLNDHWMFWEDIRTIAKVD